MIQQVLNRQLLKDVLDNIQTAIQADASDDRRASTGTPTDDLNQTERAELLNDVKTAMEFKDPQATPASDRRGGVAEEPSKADLNAYIPRSAELSNLQAAIEKYFYEKRAETVETPEADDRRGSSAPMAGSQITLDRWNTYLPDRRLGGAFEQTDIRWISAWFAEGVRKYRGKYPFNPRPARKEPVALPDDNLRIIVFGDWGSGIPRAKKVAQRIREHLDDGKRQGLQQHVIHLGDVYYAGWKYEYEKRFLADWPVRMDEKDTIGSFNLNGNHDMYGGGHAFFEVALADPRFAPWQGKSSLFHLANNHWQLFGLDTSHDDGGLKDDQAAWLQGAARKGVKTMLLSHHQYCSSYETAPQDLIDKINPVLDKINVTAWLWGHEHRCMTYKPLPGIRFPRCLGHAGVPVYQTHDLDGPIPEPGEWEYRDYVDGFVELWAKFGFAVLDFHGAKIDVRYFNEDGAKPDRQETIE